MLERHVPCRRHGPGRTTRWYSREERCPREVLRGDDACDGGGDDGDDGDGACGDVRDDPDDDDGDCRDGGDSHGVHRSQRCDCHK